MLRVGILLIIAYVCIFVHDNYKKKVENMKLPMSKYF